MPTGRHHPRLSPFSFPHDFKTSPRFRSERNHSTFKIHPRLPPFSLCTILKSPPVPGASAITPDLKYPPLSDEYTTANLSACDRDRQRPFSTSNRISHISKKSGSVLAPHLELNELDARVTPCELHARYRLHRNKYLHGNMRWKTLTDNYSMLSFAPFYNFKIFVRNC